MKSTLPFFKIFCLIFFIIVLAFNSFSQCSVSIAGGQAGRTLMAQASTVGPSYSYQWYNSGGLIPGATSAYLISSVIPDCYTVNVTNVNTSVTCSATKCTQQSLHHVMNINITGNINSGNYTGSGTVNYDLTGVSNVPSTFSANLNYTNVPSGWSTSLTLLNSMFTCFYNNAEDDKPYKPLNYYSVAGDSITLNKTITFKNSSNITLGVILVTGTLIAYNIDSSNLTLDFQGNYSGPINIDSVSVSSADIHQVAVGEIQETFSQINYLTSGSTITAFTQTTYNYNTILQLPGDEVNLRTVTSFSLGNPLLVTGTAYYVMKSNIPTLSQWSLIILALLFLSSTMIFIYKRDTSLAITGTNDLSPSNNKPLFDKILYIKVLAGVLTVAVAALFASYVYFGSVTITDTIGTVVSAYLVAYMVHLYLLRRNK